jgi:hypothetical protein
MNLLSVREAINWLGLTEPAFRCATQGQRATVVTREVVWTGHDRAFVEAMIAELGILLDAETATVSIVRVDRSLQMYTVGDGSVALWLVAGPNRLEVWRKIVGTRDETVFELHDPDSQSGAAPLPCAGRSDSSP